MDGSQTLFSEVADAQEAARQAEVYARAMKSIRAEEQARINAGRTVMSAMTSGSEIANSPFMKFVHMFLIGFAMIIPIVALWTVAL